MARGHGGKNISAKARAKRDAERRQRRKSRHIPKKTFGEFYSSAMEIDSEARADAFVKHVVDGWEKKGETKGKARPELERLVRSNVAYFARYYDDETVLRIERVFKTGHPIFGNLAEKGHPTADEAFQAGVDLASGKLKIEVK